MTAGETRVYATAERERRALERAQFEANVKRYHRNVRMKGGAAVVGLVGIVAGLGYWVLSPRTVSAHCVQDDAEGGPIIVPDDYCVGRVGDSNGVFIYSGHQYRYYYGSTGGVGTRPAGGGTVRPFGTTAKTSSGMTVNTSADGGRSSGSVIERGGLGGKSYSAGG